MVSFSAWILWIMIRPQPIDFEGTKVPNPLGVQALAHPGILGVALWS
jgi:hypothetical protein